MKRYVLFRSIVQFKQQSALLEQHITAVGTVRSCWSLWFGTSAPERCGLVRSWGQD